LASANRPRNASDGLAGLANDKPDIRRESPALPLMFLFPEK
jgi:hypothetical protein